MANLTHAEKLKAAQLQAIQMVLPESAEVADMLRAWRAADTRYWGGQLKPCWLTAAIEPYGKRIGHWEPGARTLNLIPTLWADPRAVTCVMVHECCHQAQDQLYRQLDRAAKGPRGRWTDSSHRCPSWSRAVEDVIQTDGLDVFCPVWRRSTGNLWRPWVPVTEDWLTWEQADPDATVDGRRLLGFKAARGFMTGITPEELGRALNPAAGAAENEPVEWDL